MKSGSKIIYLFQNIRQVILAERWCTLNKVRAMVIPVPRPFSSECGMCLLFSDEESHKFETYIQQTAVAIERINIESNERNI